MFQKNIAGAIVMPSIAVLSTMSTLWAVDEFLYSSLPESLTWIQILGVLLLLFLFVVLPSAFFIRNWSDNHFGLHGAIHWVFFGVLFGCLTILLTVKLFDPLDQLERGATSFLIKKSVNTLSVWVSAYVCHYLIFRMPKRIMLKLQVI